MSADADFPTSVAQESTSYREEDDPDATRPPSAGTPTSAGMRFRILRPHAKGGLGEVFVALDKELHREVALKEIRNRYADDRESRARFVMEAEITGGLEHPGIVPVYGLGQYADGRPYYAMRFIRGDSLQDAIARFHSPEAGPRDAGERELALRDLLRRFVDVCNAVAYAHSRGVLHRDLKPCNVMLGKYRETLVVDWGLAKTAERKEVASHIDEPALKPLSSGDSTPTQMGTALGTPAYMSPEQAAGRLDQLGPASDIYSLGATLYCLLTGKPAFQGEDVGAILRAVQRGEFPPPRRIQRDVPPGLEAICLKAMAHLPEERYPSAKALAEDIELWLADEPIRAWREPWHLRGGRWVRRHKPLVAALNATVLMAGVLACVGAWWWAREEQQRRQGVELALVKVSRLEQLARWAEADAVLEQAKNQLGEDGARDLRQRLQQAHDDLNLVTRLDAIRLKKATIVDGRFDYDTADREYAAAFRAASLFEVGEDAATAAARIVPSAVRDVLVAAVDDWADCAKDKSRRAWLLQVARLADRDVRWHRLRDPAVWEDGSALAQRASQVEAAELSPQLASVLGERLTALGEDAEPLLRKVQERHPGDFWINLALGNALLWHNWASFELDDAPARYKLWEAVSYYRAALALRPRTTVVHSDLATALWKLHRAEDAVVESQKALALDPQLAHAHNGLGLALRELGRPEEAAAEFRKAIALEPKRSRPHNNLANALSDLHRPDEAIAEHRRAIALNPKYARAYLNMADTLLQRGELSESRRAGERCLKLLPADHPLHTAAAHQLRKCEQMIALEEKLPAILGGKGKPTGSAELLDLAHLCCYKKSYVAAVRFWADAFAAEPKLADDLPKGHRYNAACTAALAAAGQGRDASVIDDSERARLRQQARDWLRADLDLWSKQIEKGTSHDRAAAKKALHHWQQDADLASIRADAGLDNLPDAERADCRKLWNEVAALVKK